MQLKVPVLASAILSLALLSGCDGSSKMRGLSDEELSEKYSRCLDKKPTSPGGATACENMRKECERRKNDLGIYVCRSH